MSKGTSVKRFTRWELVIAAAGWHAGRGASLAELGQGIRCRRCCLVVTPAAAAAAVVVVSAALNGLALDDPAAVAALDAHAQRAFNSTFFLGDNCNHEHLARDAEEAPQEAFRRCRLYCVGRVAIFLHIHVHDEVQWRPARCFSSISPGVDQVLEGANGRVAGFADSQKERQIDHYHEVAIRHSDLHQQSQPDQDLQHAGTRRAQATLDLLALCALVWALPKYALTYASYTQKRVDNTKDVHDPHYTK
mmetsp:Transcript_70328/g.128830  ORF Transcript_70328/g.128830 Transcript_70328/m.128830 type:complete len:248 (-) Transcript_70328:284-1027(-)